MTETIGPEVAQEIVRKAFISVCENDEYLLRTEANERSVTHRFAVYIEREIAFQLKDMNYHVDCEYNRSDKNPKRLRDFKRTNNCDDTEGATVYPDIVVHERGTQKNIIVIEAKLSRAGLYCDDDPSFIRDRCKLKAYRDELGYKYAFFVIFPIGNTLASLDFTRPDEFIFPIV